MSDFTDGLKNSRAQEALSRALCGNKQFRRFKDMLNSFPLEREHWFLYEAGRRRDYIEEWARTQDVELDFGEDTAGDPSDG